MASVFILEAEHPHQPGRIIKPFLHKSGADKEACELANIMLKDMGLAPSATVGTWQRYAKFIENETESGYVLVNEHEIIETN